MPAPYPKPQKEYTQGVDNPSRREEKVMDLESDAAGLSKLAQERKAAGYGSKDANRLMQKKTEQASRLRKQAPKGSRKILYKSVYR